MRHFNFYQCKKKRTGILSPFFLLQHTCIHADLHTYTHSSKSIISPLFRLKLLRLSGGLGWLGHCNCSEWVTHSVCACMCVCECVCLCACVCVMGVRHKGKDYTTLPCTCPVVCFVNSCHPLHSTKSTPVKALQLYNAQEL